MEPTALTSCESEPIHLCGAIQPHGFLVGLDRLSGKIVLASRNISEHTGLSLEEIVGKQGLDVCDWRKRFPHLMSYISDSLEIIEVEVGTTTTNQVPAFLPALDLLTNSSPDQSLFQRMADCVSKLTNFERVMVYKFNQDWSGTVVAEMLQKGNADLAVKSAYDDPAERTGNADLTSDSHAFDSFLNLRFPADDIPRQARELYVRNPIRIIPDVNSKPVPIVPASMAASIDLAQSILRSVSPVHIEYLRNMGVGASMSISIVIEKRLWGMVACHHRRAVAVDPQLRAMLSTLGKLFARMIETEIQSVAHAGHSQARARQLSLLGALAQTNDILYGAELCASQMMDLVSASGMAIVEENKSRLLGNCPSPDAVKDIAAQITDKIDDSNFFVTDDASNIGIVDKARASGILAASVSKDPQRWIIWFRPELIAEVHWAGEPEKLTSDEQDRLHPRRSFKLWKQQVQGRSAPWTEEEIQSAAVLSDYFRQRLAAEARFELAIEAGGQPVLLVDEADVIRGHNRAAMNLFAPVAILGTHLSTILPSGIRTSTIVRAGGTKVEVEVTESPLSTPEGLFKLTTISDVSDQRHSERQRTDLALALADSNQKMEQFVDTIAHDLRAPLLSMRHLVEWIEQDLGSALSGQTRENMETLSRRVGKMNEQLTSLLQYSKAGHMRAEIEMVDLHEVVTSIIDAIDATQAYKCELEALPVIETVKAPLEHVLHNLIDNAAKHAGSPGTTIKVSASDGREFLTISVEDEGVGIPIQYQDEVFQPLRTLAGADANHHGMGLAFVKRIVEQSGGKISLVSTPGKGSTFSFTWKKVWDPNRDILTWKTST